MWKRAGSVTSEKTSLAVARDIAVLFSAVAFKKHGARLPGTRGASFRGRLRGEESRRTSRRFITMWAQAVETVVSPLPKVRSIEAPPRRRTRVRPTFSSPRWRGEARRPRRERSRARWPRAVTAAPRDKTQAQPKKRPKAPAPTEPLNEYEREREARIARNKPMLHQPASRPTPTRSWRARRALRRKRNAHPLGRGRPRRRRNAGRTRARPRPPRAPSTRVTRNRGKALDEDPAFARLAAENPAEYGFLVADAKEKRKKETRLLADAEHTRSCEAWCDAAGLARGPKMDGRFRGWVAERRLRRAGHRAHRRGALVPNAGAETRLWEGAKPRRLRCA